MAVRKKKRNQAKTGCLIWLGAFLILLILFLVKFEDIRTAVEKTGFIDALNHAVSKQDSVPQQKPQGTKPEAPAPISELPLAAPVIIAGIRTSVIINIGTATIASTVGANTLGTPIIIGLSGFNTAYIVQGALLVALAAIVVDRAFERLALYLSRHRREQ